MDKSRLIIALLISAVMGALLWELIRISLRRDKPKVGFAAMSKKQRRAIARMGGLAAAKARRERNERLD